MKKWNLKVKSNPQEIIEKLDSSLQSVGGFIFNTDHDNNDSVLFKIRKPVKYPDQILHRNRIVVNGKIVKTDTEHEADVEITFTQHLFMTLTVFSVIISGLALIAMISRITDTTTMYILGGILVVVGLVLWIAKQKKFEKDILSYKTLISGLIES